MGGNDSVSLHQKSCAFLWLSNTFIACEDILDLNSFAKI